MSDPDDPLHKLRITSYAKVDSLVCRDPLIRNHFSKSAMLIALRDVARIRLEAFEKLIDESLAETPLPSSSKEVLH